jgi:hypothetical protein
MSPARLAQTLTTAGLIGCLIFWFLLPSDFGRVLGMGLALGGSSIAYGQGQKPLVVPLFALLALLILALRYTDGQWGSYLLGLGSGAGVPYLMYRLKP